MRKQLSFLCLLVVFSVVFNFPQTVKAESATPKTFGELGNSQINWGEFWNLFNAYSAWDLEYNMGNGWISDKTQLTVMKNYTDQEGFPRVKNDSSRVKITLNFTALYNADYRLTFGIDVKVKNYLYVNGQYNYSIIYEDYRCFFDWSDIKDIPTLIITHGMKQVNNNEYFWFRIRRNAVSQGTNFVLDPTFGEEGAGDIDCSVGFADYWKWGSKFTLTEEGTVQNISLYFKSSPANGQGVTCGIYNITGADNPDTLQGETNEIDGAAIGAASWVTFDGNDFPLLLSADDYVLAFSSDSGGGWNARIEQTSTSWYCRNSDEPPMDAAWGATNKVANDHICIYATYTVAASIENFYGSVNQTLGIESSLSCCSLVTLQ